MKNKRAAKEKARRRQNREAINKLTPEDIIKGAVEYDTVMWLFMLHDKFGFGKQRLERALAHRDEIGDAADQGYLSFADMAQVLRDEVKLDI